MIFNKSNIIALITILILSINCYSQKTKQSKSSIIKLNLTNLLNPFSFQSIDIGFEKYVFERTSIQAEIGFPIYKYNLQGYYSSNSDTLFGKNIGFKSNIELRHYRWPLNKNRKSNFYLALNLSYAQHRTNININYTIDSTIESKDCFYLKRNEFGITPATGIKMSFSKVLFEMFMGLGIINNQIQNTNREYRNEVDLLVTQRHNVFGIGKTNFSENSGWRISPNIGIRIGILLN